MTTLHTYSFRAECQKDAELFYNLIQTEGYEIGNITIVPVVLEGGLRPPDVEEEFQCNTDDLDFLIRLTHKGDDLHILRQTLRKCPLRENSLERDLSRDFTPEGLEKVNQLVTRMREVAKTRKGKSVLDSVRAVRPLTPEEKDVDFFPPREG